ncbi:MAG: PaaI family thioesterase [Euryarchaeota archaeon]|nr:PaaI family thioesterase [Euryarchaeota archaeon]
MEIATAAPPETHRRGLENLYHTANCNRYFRPRLGVGDGTAHVALDVRDDLLHAAHAVHGSVYFKLLDDAAFFAANSKVLDVFVMTASFQLDLLRPVTAGTMDARGKVVDTGRSRIIAEATLHNEGRLVGRGTGTFMPSRIALGPDVGYR